MLKFSDTQFSQLDDAALRQFAARACAFLTEHFADAAEVPQAQLLESVMAQFARARRHGLETDRQLLAYLVTAWLLGPTFDDYFTPPRLVLDDAGYSADEKIEWLEGWTVELLHRLSPDAVVPTFSARC